MNDKTEEPYLTGRTNMPPNSTRCRACGHGWWIGNVNASQSCPECGEKTEIAQHNNAGTVVAERTLPDPKPRSKRRKRG